MQREEPVFMVTGHKEDVSKAKREILSAAKHFSQSRAKRKNNLGSAMLSSPGPPANITSHVTKQVRVPFGMVGLVVGHRGANIKRIQRQTNTLIMTPSRYMAAVFYVTGLPESVEVAKNLIVMYITVRTGWGMDSVFPKNFLKPYPKLLQSIYKPGFGGLFTYKETLPSDNMFPSTVSSNSGCSSTSSSCSASRATSLRDLNSISGTSLDRDKCLGKSPSFETATSSYSIWSFSIWPLN